MSEATLREHEHDVEHARAKLARDLAILRSPSTFSAFKEDIKHDTLDAKDALVRNAKSTAQSAVNELVKDLKAKAAANPAAALAIGAGIAWRLIHRPPIATTLIGAGLFSLWRTPAERPPTGVEPNYFLLGKERLKEQASELASSTKEAGVDVGEAITAKATQLANAAKEAAQQLGESVSEASGRSQFKPAAEHPGDEVSRTRHNFSDYARTATPSSAPVKSDELIRQTVLAEDASNQQLRDRLLLGIAGVAVATALGMAYRNRAAEHA
jgi:hypothetical protein